MYSNVFFDSAPIIYLLDNDPIFFQKAFDFICKCDSTTHFYTSTISELEYKVVPYRKNNFDKIKSFSRFLEELNFTVIGINRDVADTAAQIRAKYKSIKGLDAMQIAACINSRCDTFLTNDKQLLQVSEVNAMLLEKL